MFFRTNQQDLSRLIDVQLLVSQKLGDRHQFKVGGSLGKQLVPNNPTEKLFMVSERETINY